MTQTQLYIRPFAATESDYLALAAVLADESPEIPLSVSELKVDARHFETQGTLFERFALELGGEIVGFATLLAPFWSASSNKLNTRIAVKRMPGRQEIFAEGFAFVAERAKAYSPDALLSGGRSDDTEKMEFLEQQGFVETMRFPFKRIDLENASLDKFAEHRKRAEESGISIVPLASVKPNRPDWCRELYELENRLMGDVPLPDPYTPMEYEKFEIMANDPEASDHNWFFVAIDPHTNQYIGLTMLFPSKAKKESSFTGLTGILPDYRRRGIASALKLTSFDHARANGVRYIHTDNEENNPMGQLNREMGFRDIFSMVSHERKPAFPA